MIFIRKSKESPSLANHLTHMIKEFYENGHRSPKIIRLPIWRQHELEECFSGLLFKPMSATEKQIYGNKNYFHGIPFIYVVGRDWIELE